MAKKKKSLLMHESASKDEYLLIRQKQAKSKLWVFIIVFVVCLGLGVYLANVFVTNQPEKEYRFELLGEKQIVLSLDQNYEEPGVILIDKDRDWSKNVTITGEVLNEPGVYFIEYSISNGTYANITLTRVVVVSGGDD